MLQKIDHLGIAVRDLDKAIAQFTKTLGLTIIHREVVEDQGVEVATFPIGESAIELITPVGADSGVARFLEKRGEGIHHVCLEVPDIEAELRRLAESGARLIDEKPRRGAGGHLIAFIHPRSVGGVLTEIKQVR